MGFTVSTGALMLELAALVAFTSIATPHLLGMDDAQAL